MKYIGLNWTLALKFSIGKKKRMRDCRILMAHDCTLYNNAFYYHVRINDTKFESLTPPQHLTNIRSQHLLIIYSRNATVYGSVSVQIDHWVRK